jgi:hypothetical protein
MDSPSRAIMLALQRLTSGSSRSNGIWAGGGAAAASSGRGGSSGRQLQLSSIGSSVGAVTRSSSLIRLSVCQTLTKPLNKSSRSSSAADLQEVDSAAAAVGGSSGGGAVSAASASGPRDSGTRKGLRPSISDSNLQAIALAASAAAGQVSGTGSYSLGQPPVARHRRAHSSSSTGAIAGGDTIVSGAVLNATVAADSPLHAAGCSSTGVYAGAGSGGGVDSSGGGALLAPAAATATSVVNKAAIISFKKVEVLVGTLDLNTDQVCLAGACLFLCVACVFLRMPDHIAWLRYALQPVAACQGLHQRVDSHPSHNCSLVCSSEASHIRSKHYCAQAPMACPLSQIVCSKAS